MGVEKSLSTSWDRVGERWGEGKAELGGESGKRNVACPIKAWRVRAFEGIGSRKCFAGYDISGPFYVRFLQPIPYTCQDPGTLRNSTLRLRRTCPLALHRPSRLSPARISQESLTNVATHYNSLPMPRPASSSSFHCSW